MLGKGKTIAFDCSSSAWIATSCNLHVEIRSPDRDIFMRPGTPDPCLDFDVTPCSLSVSDDPSNTLDREQTILGETGSDLSQMALGHQTGTVSGGSHVQGGLCSISHFQALPMWCN